jgi:hypothetical protein
MSVCRCASQCLRGSCISRSAVALAGFACALLILGCEKPAAQAHKRPKGLPSPPDNSPPTLVASTSELKRTVVVPTLDTPLPEGKSALWCSSFQLAWNRAEKDFTGGPVQLRHAETAAGRLNKAQESEADLEAADFLVTAGSLKDVLATIDSEVPRRFPGTKVPKIDGPPDALVAFALLKAGVRYTYEFKDNPQVLSFTDSAGVKTPVHSFGLLPTASSPDESDARFARQLVALLYVSGDEHHPSEFAVDLCRETQPYQIVLACLNRKETLAATLADLEGKIKESPGLAKYRLDEDELLVPNMSWRVSHHFRELEGTDKIVLNGRAKGLFLAAAIQEMEFKLDRRGAEILASSYAAFADGGPKELHFNRPFLLYLKKRDAARPFFVMWVDDAELLQAWKGDSSPNGKAKSERGGGGH